MTSNFPPKLGRFTQRDAARFRAITSQLARMRAAGWDRNTHPDFDILEPELAALGEKMTVSPDAVRAATA